MPATCAGEEYSEGLYVVFLLVVEVLRVEQCYLFKFGKWTRPMDAHHHNLYLTRREDISRKQSSRTTLTRKTGMRKDNPSQDRNQVGDSMCFSAYKTTLGMFLLNLSIAESTIHASQNLFLSFL